MNHKLVPTLLTEPRSEVLRNEHCVYQTEQELYKALIEAAPDVTVELVGEIANLGPAKYCVKFATIPPALGTKLYALKGAMRERPVIGRVDMGKLVLEIAK